MNKFVKTLTVIAAAFLTASAFAWPTQPVKIVIPYGTGGTTDILVRTLEPKLSKILGQPVVIVNKPGGNTWIGATEVAKSNDGHTFLTIADDIVPNSIKEPNNPGAIDNFTPVAYMAHSPIMVITSTNGKLKDPKELLAANNVTYGNAGSVFSIGNLMLRNTRPDWTAVSFKSGPEMSVNVASQQVTVGAGSILQTSKYIKTGNVVPVMVYSKKRADAFPDVPTSFEAGIPLEGNVWLATFAPKNMSKEAVDKMGRAIIQALNDKELVKPLLARGLAVEPKAAVEFKKFLDNYNKDVRKFMAAYKE